MRRFCLVLLFIPLLSVKAQPEGLAVVPTRTAMPTCAPVPT